MEDKTMAANLERIHNIYMDREEKPVEKVALMVIKFLGTDWLKKPAVLLDYVQITSQQNPKEQQSVPLGDKIQFFFAVSIDAVVAEGDGQVVNKWMVGILCSKCVCTC